MIALRRATKRILPAGQRFGRALVGPDLLLLLLVFAVPMALLLVYSFLRIDLNTKELIFDWNIDSYARLLDPVYSSSILRSVGVSVLAALVCLVIGLPFAYAMIRVSRTTQLLMLIAIIIPYYTSQVVLSYAWLMLLGPSGAVTSALSGMGLVPEGTDLRYTLFAVIIGMIYSYLPLMLLPLYVALERLDSSLLDASADLGLRPSKTFFKVVIPAALPGIIAGLILVGIPALGEYTIPAVLGGNKILLMGNVIVGEFQATGNYPFGSALAVTLMAATVTVLGIGALVARKLGSQRGTMK